MHGEISTEFSFTNLTGIRCVIQQRPSKISAVNFQVEVSLKIHSKKHPHLFFQHWCRKV